MANAATRADFTARVLRVNLLNMPVPNVWIEKV
jgi:hypothetical protein